MIHYRSKSIVGLATAAILLTWSIAAMGQGGAKTVINFDDLAVGTVVTDQYASLGVLFSPWGGVPVGEVHTQPEYGTYFFGNSEPNFLLVGIGHETITFIDCSASGFFPVTFSR